MEILYLAQVCISTDLKHKYDKISLGECGLQTLLLSSLPKGFGMVLLS